MTPWPSTPTIRVQRHRDRYPGSGDRSSDLYSNTITSTSRLISALDRGWVVADIYMDDDEIIFVAVRECKDSASPAPTPSSTLTT